jgi:hypothetical protein
MPLDECARCDNRYPTFRIRLGMQNCRAVCEVCEYQGPVRKTIKSAESAWNVCNAKLRKSIGPKSGCESEGDE